LIWRHWNSEFPAKSKAKVFYRGGNENADYEKVSNRIVGDFPGGGRSGPAKSRSCGCGMQNQYLMEKFRLRKIPDLL
jgi:hypothetical protein